MELTIPLPELKGPPGPQQPPPIEYRGNAGIREASLPSQVRGKKSSKGHGSRIPHAATAVVGKGTPSIPPEEAVGAYASGSTGAILLSVPQEPLAQRAVMKGSTPDRSRSRDPPREIMPELPTAPGQAVMDVPDYLLPIMASVGVGHLSLDQPRMRSTGGSTPPRPTGANPPNVRNFFEAFNQPQVHEEQVKAIQQFTAGLRDVSQLAGSPAQQETPHTNRTSSASAKGGRTSSPHAPKDTAAAASRESESPQAGSSGGSPEPPSADRGRQPSLQERMRSAFHWPSLKPITGSGRRPKSPPLPPRPKTEPAPKRASSTPRLPGSASAESVSGTTPSAPANPITIVPAVQIPAPVAVEPTTAPPAPEVTSDAETLPLPGLPGAAEEENVPSPVEEEIERTMDDLYVTALEGVTLRESAPTETAPVVTLTEHMGATSSTFIGLMADIPLPTVTAVSGTATESVVNPTEPVSKDTKEATSSEPVNPTVEPPSAEADAEKSSAKPKAKAKSASTRKPRASKETSEEETPEQKEEREKAEKMADELVRQEEAEKKKASCQGC